MSVGATVPDMAVSSGLVSATSVFYFLLVPALALWYIYWRVSRRHMIELAERIPGPKGWPLIGNALEFRGSSPGKNFFIFILYNRFRY